jgi:hypothetical protein
MLLPASSKRSFRRVESGGGSAWGEGDNGTPRKAQTAQPQSLFANRWPRRVGLTVKADSAIPGASSSRYVLSGMIWFEDQKKKVRGEEEKAE